MGRYNETLERMRNVDVSVASDTRVDLRERDLEVGVKGVRDLQHRRYQRSQLPPTSDELTSKSMVIMLVPSAESLGNTLMCVTMGGTFKPARVRHCEHNY